MLENNSARQRSLAIRIGPRSRIDASPPSPSRRMEDRSPQEVASLKGKERVPKTPTTNVQSLVTLNQMDEANLQQPGDYVVSLPKHGDRVSKVTNKHNGGNIFFYNSHLHV